MGLKIWLINRFIFDKYILYKIIEIQSYYMIKLDDVASARLVGYTLVKSRD